MTFPKFITIQYQLLIDRLPHLDSIFVSIWFFALVFVRIYFPIATIIGYWHRESQWTVEQEALFNENKVGAVMYLYLVDIIQGKVDEEETREIN